MCQYDIPFKVQIKQIINYLMTWNILVKCLAKQLPECKQNTQYKVQEKQHNKFPSKWTLILKQN
jgi:hypothetical protein